MLAFRRKFEVLYPLDVQLDEESEDGQGRRDHPA
jgi:hypothetical protein